MGKFLNDEHVQDYAAFLPVVSSRISYFAYEIPQLLSCWELVRQLLARKS
jgi:hypothetical protein